MTYSQIAKINNKEFRSILKDENKKQIMEEKDTESRSCNMIIIHGATEMSHWDDEYLKEVNKRKVSILMKDVELDIQPKSTFRLGTRKHEKQRPLKVIFKSENDQRMVMQNLSCLKKFAKPQLLKKV